MMFHRQIVVRLARAATWLVAVVLGAGLGAVLAPTTYVSAAAEASDTSKTSTTEGHGYGGTGDWLVLDITDEGVSVRGFGFLADSSVVVQVGGVEVVVSADELGAVDTFISWDDLEVASTTGALALVTSDDPTAPLDSELVSRESWTVSGLTSEGQPTLRSADTNSAADPAGDEESGTQLTVVAAGLIGAAVPMWVLRRRPRAGGDSSP